MPSILHDRARKLAESSGLRCFDKDGIDCGRCIGCDKRDRLSAAMVALARDFARKAPYDVECARCEASEAWRSAKLATHDEWVRELRGVAEFDREWSKKIEAGK